MYWKEHIAHGDAQNYPSVLRESELRLHKPQENWHTSDVWFVQQGGLICDLVTRAKPSPNLG